MPTKSWEYLKGQSEAEFLSIARDRYHDGLRCDSDDREAAKNDVRMLAGGDLQWDKDVVKDRKGDGTRPARPVLTWNRLRGPVYQVTNDGRMNKPGIITTALDGGDKDTALHYFQPRIRQIEYETDADIAYDTCRQQAVSSGRGFIRVRTDWKSPTSMEQVIHIDEIENQFSVIIDPAAKEYDRSDAGWMFVDSIISEDTYKRRYGEEAFKAYTAFASDYDGSNGGEWFQTGNVHETEYWKVNYTKDIVYRQEDGMEFLASDLKKTGQKLEDIQPKVVAKRDTQIPQVIQYIIDGAQILEENLWIGSTIPIVPQWGDSMWVDGDRRTFSLIRDSIGPQKLLNLTVSHIAELTSNIQKTKYAVAEGQITGHEDEWDPNSPRLYKQYKLYDAAGRQLPPPVPDQSEPPIQSLVQQAGMAIDGIKAGTNIFSASLGDRSNETSGKAIDARKLESDVANFHHHDNEARTRKAIGKILIEIIPKIDKGKKSVAVRSEDGKSKMIPIGQPFKDDNGNEVKVNPNGIGYGVGVRTGPTYTSMREQAADAYSNIAKVDKNFMGIAGDLYFRTMDFPGADQIADRYENAVIPQSVRPNKDNPLPPEAQAKIGAMEQQMAQMTEIGTMLGDKCEKLEAELKSKQMEVDAKMTVAAWQEETKRTIALANIELKAGMQMLQTEIQRIQQQQTQIQQDREALMAAISQLQQPVQPGNGGNPGNPQMPTQSAAPGAAAGSQEVQGEI